MLRIASTSTMSLLGFLYMACFLGCSYGDGSEPTNRNYPPLTPVYQYPADSSANVSTTPSLKWEGTSFNYRYDIYLDSINPPTKQISLAQGHNWVNVSTLQYNSVYYWKVVATDGINPPVSGPVWCFTTRQPTYGSYPGEVRSFPLGSTGLTIEMCWCPPGSFQMGTPVRGVSTDKLESPVHTVTIAEGFWLSKYEVTQGQWTAVMSYNLSAFRDRSNSKLLPVEMVQYNEVQMFEVNTGGDYFLPSEAQWEYACRAGTSTLFYCGDTLSSGSIGSFIRSNSNSNGVTHPVGEKIANAWNLHDMSGNVWEWCEDLYHDNYNGAPCDGSPWVTDAQNSNHIIRGGSWMHNLDACRSAFRFAKYSGKYYIGFRLCRQP
ncbi:MAG: formylglycine-generating enzyme family protein [bacterium]|nr:formylglycine-generating enzyme family protein [bacterium]